MIAPARSIVVALVLYSLAPYLLLLAAQLSPHVAPEHTLYSLGLLIT
jgi:hypothetical protein